MSRKEKEALYIAEQRKLQRHWGNPIAVDEWDHVPLMTDEELDQSIENIKGQVSFEWIYQIVITVIAVSFGLFIVYLFS